MDEAFFSALIAIIATATSVYSYYYDRNALPSILLMTVFSMMTIAFWQAVPIIILLAFLWRKISYGTFAALNMLASVTLSYFFLRLFLAAELPFYLIAFASVIAICSLAVFGITQ
ncbi:MAG: hypothetical protein QXO69_00275, partial [archaeon]